MKHSLRVLAVSVLTLVMLSCLPLSPVLAWQNSALADSPFIGTVVITKNGYQNARQSNTDSTVVFRVHYGERYLCTAETEDGWYEIMLPTLNKVYVSSNPENTTLLRGETAEQTLSGFFLPFSIKADKRLDLYSQPKYTAQARRVSGDGSSETTFYYSQGTELNAIGKTTRGGEDWYLLIGDNNGVRELLWVRAADCTLVSGDPDFNLIPDWWYD